MKDSKAQEMATDDLFVSLEMLAFEMEEVADQARRGSSAQLLQSTKKAREISAQLEKIVAQLEAETAQFGALDELMGETIV